MIKCTDETCFNNDPSNKYLCESCFNHFMVDGMTLEDLYEMYIGVKEILDQRGVFEDIVKAIDPDMAMEDGFKEDLENFRKNLFNIFNDIMQTKIALGKK